MNSKKLIALVKESKDENWYDSDIWTQGQEMLEKIAEHLEQCQACRSNFDAMDYGEGNLADFERRLSNSTLSDWICEEAV